MRVSGMTTKAKFEGHQQHEEEENRVLRAQPEGGHVKQEVDRFGTTKEKEEDPPCPAWVRRVKQEIDRFGTKKEEEEENKVLRVQCELGRVNSWRADSEKGNQVIRALLEFGLVKQEAKGGALRIKKALEGEWHDHRGQV